jgi:hypothetical protein
LSPSFVGCSAFHDGCWVFAGIEGRGEEHSTASKERPTLSVPQLFF